MMQQGNLNFSGFHHLSRDMPVNSSRPAALSRNQSGSMWQMNENYPYILDWFYTLQPQSSSDDDDDGDASREVPSQSLDVIAEHNNKEEDFWTLRQTEKKCDEEWGHLYESRRNCHLEASTSTPLFRESILHHEEKEEEDQQQASGKRWWARNRSAVTVNPDTETSFLEPPNFFLRGRDDDYYNNISEEEEEDEEDGLDWRNSGRLSKSFIMDDLKGDFDLPFDIYRRQPGDAEDLGPLDNV